MCYKKMIESISFNLNKNDTIIEFNKVFKKYPNVMALEDISFKIKKGEIFCLIGPNGAGKSTTVKLITGQIAATNGRIHVNAKDPIKNRKELLGIFGLVPQEIALYTELTGRENLEFHGRLYNLSKEIMNQKIDQLLELAGLANRQKDLVKTYSGGMKRRLQLIRALLHEPDIVILDEPTLGVDVQSRNAIHNYIRELPSKGKTIVLTTNYMEEAERLADRVVILDGKIIEGPGRVLEIQESVFPNSIIEFKIQRDQQNDDFINNFLVEKLSGNIISEKSVSDTHVLLQVVFNTPKIDYIFSEFISYIKEHGIKIEEFTLKRPNLEDVFLKLTGKEFRE
jgi:ABC-2 type transport system ATP-binding protein